MRFVYFKNLDEIRSGKRTLVHLSMKSTWSCVDLVFGATKLCDESVLECDILEVRKVRLLEDMTPESLEALGCTEQEYEKRWNDIQSNPRFDTNPEVYRISFRLTGKEEIRGLTLVEEEDLHCFQALDDAAKVLSFETDKEVFGGKAD